MTLGKRPHVPKVRGCHECSKRRIHCDRTEPSCTKCAAKGIKCSGFGVRYRFKVDIASRTKSGGKHESLLSQCYAGSNDETAQSNLLSTVLDRQASNQIDGEAHDLATDVAWYSRCFDDYNQSIQYGPSVIPHSTDVITGSDLLTWTSNALPTQQPQDPACFFTHELSSFEAWKEYFLLYFADRIAPEMVTIDDSCNGWRYIVLPVAFSDDLVREAVLAAATFHFSANMNDHQFRPNAIYQKAIQKLRQRQDLHNHDMMSGQSVLLALLVLLAAFMVNGYADFRTVFKLLQTALDALGGEDNLEGDLGIFLARQIQKFRGYASPLLSLTDGVSRLKLTAIPEPSPCKGWDCFRSYYKTHPDLSSSLSRLYEINRQACNIYVKRAEAGPDQPPLTKLVNGFRDSIKALPWGTPGEHILVWPTFIAALECTVPEDRQYFVDVLMQHYRRNGFVNILVALNHLQTFWSGKVTRDWPQYLAQMQVFIV